MLTIQTPEAVMFWLLEFESSTLFFTL